MSAIEICFEKLERDVIVVKEMPAGVDWFDVVDVLGIPGVVSFAMSDIKSYQASDIERYGLIERNTYAVTGKKLLVHCNGTAQFLQAAAQIVYVVATSRGVYMPEYVVRSESEYEVYRPRYAAYTNTVIGLVPFFGRPAAIALADVMVAGVYPSIRYYTGALQS